MAPTLAPLLNFIRKNRRKGILCSGLLDETGAPVPGLLQGLRANTWFFAPLGMTTRTNNGNNGSRYRTMAHLSDDDAVAKMGHPSCEEGLPAFVGSPFELSLIFGRIKV